MGEKGCAQLREWERRGVRSTEGCARAWPRERDRERKRIRVYRSSMYIYYDPLS